jgi:hypothetical protein
MRWSVMVCLLSDAGRGGCGCSAEGEGGFRRAGGCDNKVGGRRDNYARVILTDRFHPGKSTSIKRLRSKNTVRIDRIDRIDRIV